MLRLPNARNGQSTLRKNPKGNYIRDGAIQQVLICNFARTTQRSVDLSPQLL